MPNLKMELVIVGPIGQSLGADFAAFGGIEGGIICRRLETAWGNRNTSRNHGVRCAQGKWIYVVDQDVRFPIAIPAKLDLFVRQLESLKFVPDDIWMITGPYLSSPDYGYWGASYNWLSNLWLKNASIGARVLAGNLLMRRDRMLSFPFSERLLQGGEENELTGRVIAANGRVSFREDLTVFHLAEHSMLRFFERHRTHARAKAVALSSATKTRVSFSLLAHVLIRPHRWPALFVFAVATIVGFGCGFGYVFSKEKST